MTKVLVLAAGRSKRMAPIKDKNFLNFLGKPLIWHQLQTILKCGLKDIVLVGGKHNLENLKDLVREWKIPVVEQKNLDMGMCGAVLAAKNILKNEPVIVFSSNDVVDSKAFELIKSALKKNDAEGYLLAKKVDSYFPGGYLKVDKNNLVKDIIEKPGEGHEPSNLINIVVHAYKNPQDLIKYLEKVKSVKDDLYEVALAKMLKDKAKIKAIPYGGTWLPIKFPWHVMPVFEYLFSLAKARISKKAQIAKQAVVKGKVIIEDNAKVFEGAIIHGPAYIGKNSIMANNALVRNSNIGENCVVGYSTEIARSFLGSGVWTHSNYVGDSVIGDNVSFGAGTVTGNLRLDEANISVLHDGQKLDTKGNKFGLICGNDVRVGINTSLMPGIKIGANSLVGAGITVSENIPENSFVRGTFTLKISENKINIEKIRRKTS